MQEGPARPKKTSTVAVAETVAGPCLDGFARRVRQIVRALFSDHLQVGANRYKVALKD
jgi:hypothetical protein